MGMIRSFRFVLVSTGPSKPLKMIPQDVLAEFTPAHSDGGSLLVELRHHSAVEIQARARLHRAAPFTLIGF